MRSPQGVSILALRLAAILVTVDLCLAGGGLPSALGLLEDLLAIELVLARDLLAAAPARPVLGEGTGAALRTVEQAIATADPYPDAVHRALRDPSRPVCSQAPGDLTGLKAVHPVAEACATA